MMRVILVMLNLFLVCSTYANDFLPNGIYRGAIRRPDGIEIVFNMEVSRENQKQVLYIINGNERMEVDQFEKKGDSLLIQLPFFESSFSVKVEQNGDLQGYWVKRLADRDQWLPLHAEYKNAYRFPASQPAAFNIAGRWAVNFIKKDKTSKAVGEFEQQGNRVTGSFLTNDGDYRFLEGIVKNDSLLLSGFDGGFAVLFTAKINADKSLSGTLYSGSTGIVPWKATKDEDAELDDEYQLTRMKEGKNNLHFSFNNLEGKKISVRDARYKNKVTIVQILGSWCPNCIDETKYLVDVYNRYHAKGVEMIALAYERTTDTARSLAALRRLHDRLNIPYAVLNTGVTSTDPYLTEKTLPEIERIKVFPTSIIIDKKGKVRKIHTGFSGPGTGVHYEQHKKQFEKMLDQLLAE